MNRLTLLILRQRVGIYFHPLLFLFPPLPLPLWFLDDSYWPEFHTDILFYSFTNSKDGKDFVALPSMNLRGAQNKKALRNFNVGHWGIPVRKILDHFSTHHHCANIIIATDYEGKPFFFLLFMDFTFLDFYTGIPIDLFLMLGNFNVVHNSKIWTNFL